jgi:hypothetical protein
MGLLAPILVLFGRLLQGFSAGAELGAWLTLAAMISLAATLLAGAGPAATTGGRDTQGQA